jgi:hypothetical protein
MAYAPINVGPVASAYNAALSITMPTGFAAGNLLLLQSQIYQGSAATPTVSGWTRLSPGVNAKQIALWGKIAVGSDAAPSINWGSSVNVFSSAWVAAYSGNPSTLTGIVHASADELNNNKQDIDYPALAITQPDCLVIAGGARDKTSATDSATFGTLGDFVIRQSSVLPASSGNLAAVMNELIQTSPTSLAAVYQSMSTEDATTQQFESFVIALLPAVTASSRTPSLMTMGAG